MLEIIMWAFAIVGALATIVYLMEKYTDYGRKIKEYKKENNLSEETNSTNDTIELNEIFIHLDGKQINIIGKEFETEVYFNGDMISGRTPL